MPTFLMYDLDAFKLQLSDAGLGKDKIDKIVATGNPLNSDDYSLIELKTNLVLTGGDDATVTKSGDEHTLTFKSGGSSKPNLIKAKVPPRNIEFRQS